MGFSKDIRLKCLLHLVSGMAVPGVSRNLTMEGLYLECHTFNPPKRGEMAMITLYAEQDKHPVSIKCRCRINHIYADGMDITAEFAHMAKNELTLFKNLLVSNDDDDKKNRGKHSN